MKKIILFTFAFALVSLLQMRDAVANNVSIPEAPTLHSRGGVDAQGIPGTVYIRFPLRWENSWRSRRPNNHDGVWVFVKAWDGNEWTHVYLSPDSTRHHFGLGAGALHQHIHANSDIGTVLQQEERNLMAVELGFSYAQINRFDLASPWTREVVGVFIHRVGTGRGTVNLTDVNLFWPYERQGFFRDDQLAVKVFAIEMVFVPTGHFYLGCSGTNATWAAHSFTSYGSALGNPFRVDSEDSITLRNSTNRTELWAVGMDAAATWHTGAGTIPQAFPKGYRAFWIMKHEVTQQAYADFLNAISFVHQDAHSGSRDASGNVVTLLSNAVVGHNPWNNAANALWHYRNHLVVTQVGDRVQFGVNARLLTANNPANFSATVERERYDGDGVDIVGIDGQDLAMNFVSWFNLLAFAEFSGLRPMTELEFEKASRGPIFPVPGEFVWGSVLLNEVFTAWNVVNTNGAWNTASSGLLAHFNSGDEVLAVGRNSHSIHALLRRSLANASGTQSTHSSVARSVMRVGAFARENTTRESAGATFWGVLNMSDNVNEMVVSATHSAGFVFNGHHGTGNLRVDGHIQDQPLRVWPIAQGSHFPRGFRAVQWLDAGNITIGNWGGAGTSGVITITTAWDGGRISNRSGAPMHYHYRNNNPIRYQGGIRLVRTQHWLTTSRDFVAGVGSVPSPIPPPVIPDDDDGA